MSIIIQITPPSGDPVVLDAIGAAGAIGSNGWTAVLAIEFDGARAVMKVVDWAGGEGAKPAVGLYVGSGSTLVSDIANAVDIRGPAGPAGPQGDPGQIVTSGGIFTGNGVPSDSQHVDGDIYINNVNGDLYQKQSGHWVLQTNIKGPKGDKGDAGTAGVAGTAGADGASILIGSGVPASGVGNNGDLYVESVTFTLYRKSGGAWSQVGVFKGPAGSSIRVAAGAPSNSLGVDGDSYVNSSSGDLYLRTAGAYTVAGNIRGPQGPAGSQGTPGIAGPTGASTLFGTNAPSSGLGADGDSYIATATYHLYTKSAGAWTDAGTLKGANGVNGVGNAFYTGAGAPGTIVGSIDGDIYIDTSTGNVHKKSGGAWTSPIMNINGAQGPQGATGAQGNPGVKGDTGTMVIVGITAPNNGVGNNGDSFIDKTNGNFYGPKSAGAWPSPALSIVGPQGNQGVKGDTGATGAKGDTGATGDIGPQGSQGPKGDIGNTGAAGPTGSSFLSGSGVPASGLGANGDTYLNITTGDVYGPKTAGAWGSIVGSLKGVQGIQGNTGATGTRGSVWYTGSTVPGAQTGQLAGDMYVRSTNGEIYTATSPTAWSDSGFSIQGPQGVQGTAGTTGSTGPAGPSNLPITDVSAARTIDASDKGTGLRHPAADTTARAWTINNAASAPNAWAIGDTVVFINEPGSGAITIAVSGASAVLWLAGSGSTGNRSLSAGGMATAVKISANNWMINGTGLA